VDSAQFATSSEKGFPLSPGGRILTARLSIPSGLCLIGGRFHGIAKALAGLDRRIREDYARPASGI
jgi:hypothetical protein